MESALDKHCGQHFIEDVGALNDLRTSLQSTVTQKRYMMDCLIIFLICCFSFFVSGKKSTYI